MEESEYEWLLLATEQLGEAARITIVIGTIYHYCKNRRQRQSDLFTRSHGGSDESNAASRQGIRVNEAVMPDGNA